MKLIVFHLKAQGLFLLRLGHVLDAIQETQYDKNLPFYWEEKYFMRF